MDPIQVLRKIVDPHLFSTEEENKIKGNGLTREEQWENLLEILPRKVAKAYEASGRMPGHYKLFMTGEAANLNACVP